MNSEVNINCSFGGIFPIWTIILFSSYLSIAVYIAAFPDEIVSVYFSSAFSVFITFDLAFVELPI